MLRLVKVEEKNDSRPHFLMIPSLILDKQIQSMAHFWTIMILKEKKIIENDMKKIYEQKIPNDLDTYLFFYYGTKKH